MTRTLAGRTILMSGGSRGIGLAITERAARDGANVAIVAKTDTPHPKLEGTIHTAAAAIEEAGGQALPVLGDVRSQESVQEAVSSAAEGQRVALMCYSRGLAEFLKRRVEKLPKRQRPAYVGTFDAAKPHEVIGTGANLNRPAQGAREVPERGDFTRREELLIKPELLQKIWVLRKFIHDMDEIEAMEFILDKIRATKTNSEFFDMMKK